MEEEECQEVLVWVQAETVFAQAVVLENRTLVESHALMKSVQNAVQN